MIPVNVMTEKQRIPALWQIRFSPNLTMEVSVLAHLIGLNEVEVLPMNSIAMFKVSTLFLAPGTQLLYTEDNSS